MRNGFTQCGICPKVPRYLQSLRRGFTLLEVLIAMGIFFLALFAILNLVSQNLRAVRAIQPIQIDASSLAADLMLTNKLEEGFSSGDFGDLYPGYTWTQEISEVATNGLYRVDFAVMRDEGGIDKATPMTILLYRPGASRLPGGGAPTGTPGGPQTRGARR